MRVMCGIIAFFWVLHIAALCFYGAKLVKNYHLNDKLGRWGIDFLSTGIILFK